MPADSAPAPTRVVLCDDALGFPRLVASWLGAADGVQLVAHTETESDLLDVLPTARPEVVLLDFMLPEGPTEPERLERIRAAAPGARVVLVSSLPALELQDAAERLGADGWCPKATTRDQLLAALG